MLCRARHMSIGQFLESKEQTSVELFWEKKTRKYSKIDNSPFHFKKQKTKQKKPKVMDQCVLPTMTYG